MSKAVKVRPDQINDFLMAFINDHWEDHHSVTKEIYEFIYQQFPQFRYEGEGFRAVLNCNETYNPNLNLEPFTCWSQSQVGIIHFLNHEIQDQAFVEGDECYILTGKVKGINIPKIAQYLYSINLLNINQLNLFLKEEEVLNLYYVGEATQAQYDFEAIELAIKTIL